MGMDPSNPHHQVMVTNSSEDHVLMINSSSNPQQQSAEKKASSSVLVKPTQPDLNCPRCDSSNTKFCYYNNYSLSQPRYFCKGCRRYWTQGGSLRNVPVGGGCRKSNKRPSPSSSATSSCTSSKKTPQDHHIFTINSNPSSLPSLTYDSNDLTLAFSRVLHKQQQQQQPNSTSTTMQLGFDHHHHHHHDHQVLLGNPTTHGSPDTSNENNHNNGSTGFLDALRSGFLETQSGFQNFQYGFVGDQLDNQNGGGGGGGIDHLPYQEITSTTTTTTRTEDYFGNIKGGRDNGAAAADQSKVFVNFPWHQFSTTTTGDGGNINVDAASGSVPGRDQLYWNNGFGSSWHGLVNSL